MPIWCSLAHASTRALPRQFRPLAARRVFLEVPTSCPHWGNAKLRSGEGRFEFTAPIFQVVAAGGSQSPFEQVLIDFGAAKLGLNKAQAK